MGGLAIYSVYGFDHLPVNRQSLKGPPAPGPALAPGAGA